jgi:adenylate kinase
MKARRTRRLQRKIIIVTGTPGTGKSTFSKRLAREIEAAYVPLTQFVSKHRLYAGVDRERGSKIVDVARTQAKLRKVLFPSSRSTVLDTHVSEGVVPKETVKQIFVLRCHPRILEARLRRKNWKSSKVRENVLAEILDSCLTSAAKYYGLRRVVQIDTSHASVRKCVASAKRTLQNRPTRKVKIDWVTTLDDEHSLGRYLE